MKNSQTGIFSSENIRKGWIFKGGLSILDQVFSSGANFLLSVLLARWFGIREYGVYAFATAFLSLFYQVQNALIMEPMSVIGPSTYPGAIYSYLSHQRKIHVWLFMPLGLIISICAAVYGALGGDADIRNILMVMGVLAVLIQLPWLIRRSFYVINKPGQAVLYSMIYNVVLLGLLFLFHAKGWLSTPMSLVLLSTAGVVAFLIIFSRLKGPPSTKYAMHTQTLWNQNWSYGKWMLLTGGFMAIAGQAPIYLTGLLINTDASGVIKAMQNFMQPMGMSISAIVALAIPNLSRDFGLGEMQTLQRKKKLITLGMFILAGVYELLLVMFAVPLEHLIYAGRYAQYAQLIPLWGLIPVLMSLSIGSSVEIRAYQKPQGILWTAVVWMLVTLLSGFFFIRWWGLFGATISVLLGYAASCISYFYIAWRIKRI